MITIVVYPFDVPMAVPPLIIKSREQARFPELTELAQEKAKLCTKLDVLENVTQQLFTALDSQTAQQLLTSIFGAAAIAYNVCHRLRVVETG